MYLLADICHFLTCVLTKHELYTFDRDYYSLLIKYVIFAQQTASVT